MNNHTFWRKITAKKTQSLIFLSFFCLITASLQANSSILAYQESTKLSISMKNATLRELFSYIEKTSEYVFFYQPSIINDKIEVSVDAKAETIRQVLDKALTNTSIYYEIKDRQIVLSKKEDALPNPNQAKRQVQGLVKDVHGDPIIGATVQLRNSKEGVITDLDGLFAISVSGRNDILVVSYIGYASQEVKASGDKLLIVVLKEDAKALEEVVVVGFGTQKKESVVGAVQTLRPSELKVPSSNISNALGGRLAGVIAVQRSGEPGQDQSNFWIRGISTFVGSAQSPLIFIDGVEASSGDLNALPPEAIENFSILKDAAATALYGARGANGVMLVTTRTGRNMEKTQINLRITQSFQAPTQTLQIADGVQFMNMYNEAEMARNPGTKPEKLRFQPDRIQATAEGRNPYIYPNVDWMDFLFKKMQLGQSANLNVTGGTNKMDYFLSASINNDGGMLKSDPNNKFDNNIRNLRYSFQANVNARLTSTTKVGVRINSQILNYSGSSAGTGTIYSQIFESPGVYFSPTLPALNGEDHILFGNASGGPINHAGGIYHNPYATMVAGYTNRNESTVTSSFTVDQDLKFITKGLSLKGLVSFKNWTRTSVTRSFDPYYYKVTNFEQLPEGTYNYEYESMNTGRTSLGTSNSNTGDRFVNVQAMLDYRRMFGKHDVSGMFVYLQRDYNVNAPGTNDFYATLPQRNQGIAGRATYGYDGRYLAEVNFGYNGSENFQEGKRFGFFPSIALGYLISNEKFFEPLSKVISNLKIRGSYGLVGNSFTSPRFPYLTQVNLNGWGYNFGDQWQNGGNGAVVTKYGTKDAHWEMGRKLNVGIDLGFFNKVNLSVDYFYENRSDIFLERRTIPSEIGLVSGAVPMANLGKVQNQGVDMTLDYNHAVNKDFFISAKGTFTFARNKLIDRDEPMVDYPYLSDLGQPLYRTRGLVALGLFKDQADIDNSPEQTFSPTVLPGDIKYADLNGDKKIDNQDRTLFGHPTEAPEIIYGLGTTLKYKNWDLSLFFQGISRVSIQMSGMHPFTGDAHSVLKFIADDYWSEADPNQNAAYPRLDLSSNTNNTQVSTFWSRDGSFLRLKNMEIGYSYKFLRVYLAGQNLFTISKFKHWDAELGSGSGMKYPTMVTGTIGAQLTF